MPTPQSNTPVTTPYFSQLLINSGLPISTADFYWVYAPGLKVPYLEYNKNLIWQKYREIRGIDDNVERLPSWSIAKLIDLLPTFIEINTNSYDENTDTEVFTKRRYELNMGKSWISYSYSEYNEDSCQFHISGDFNKCVIKSIAWLAEKGMFQSDSKANAKG